MLREEVYWTEPQKIIYRTQSDCPATQYCTDWTGELAALTQSGALAPNTCERSQVVSSSARSNRSALLVQAPDCRDFAQVCGESLFFVDAYRGGSNPGPAAKF